ncbi:uncharacterized protein LOC120452602 [Drosophila santomea]|uniref:uncharacterized protein LOC120452602 n=1 Tax=Drosophila santomea TaxID=129105 RepID=UPI0019541ABA|nr:uncharacterized protein LOC120452602 [Drosophila santomea]
MPPVLKRSLRKRSKPVQETPAEIKKTSTLSKIIIQGTEQLLLDSENNPNIRVIEKPRKMRYSKSSIPTAEPDFQLHSTPKIGNLANKSNARGMFGPIKNKQTSIEAISEISDMSIASVSVRNQPFVNFLQDFCMTRGSDPRESVQEAIAKWDKMTPKQKAEFSPENYVLKLCNQVQNRNEILNAVALQPVYETTKKNQNGFNKASKVKRLSPKLRKLTKRLNPRPRGVVSPRKSIKNAAKKEVPPMVSVRLTNSASAYKNFLRKVRQANPGLMSVEKTSLWRKMTPAEKDLYRVVSKRSQEKTNVKKTKLRALAAKRVRKQRTSRSTQMPENALHYLQSSFDIQRDGQLEIWNESNTLLRDSQRSWVTLDYISKAFEKVKNIFS